MAGSREGAADLTETPAPRQGAARPADVLVAGGGLVGLALALALRRSSGGRLAVTVVDPLGGAVPAGDGRASAIAAGGRRMLQALGAWPAEDAVQPITGMVVADGRVEDAVRPTILAFDGEVEPGEPFAHMVENAALLSALAAAALDAGVETVRGRAAGFEADAGAASAALADGSILEARLVCACDGARSTLREAAGIKMVGWDYGQSGIVTTVIHERPHGGQAEEHFLPAGPFAILPLVDDAQGRHRSSLVWTEKAAEAEQLVALDDAAFLDALVQRFGRRLGQVALASGRRAYPIGLRLARAFVAPRLALVGDAAHVVHPIAGQGLNLGLKDAAALAEVVVEAWRLGQDVGAYDVLTRYERWRRFDTVVMGATTDGLNRLFSNDSGLLRGVRDLGLGLVERMPGLKRAFIRNAAGLSGELPRLLRGELA
jgi:2-octaprenyl-6-methoxyphenol hydroxylase